MDDNTVDRLFHMLLLDPLPTYTKKEMARYIGPNNLHKYDPVRLQLTTHLMKTHSDNRKERALTKPVLVAEGRIILNDCSVHGFDYGAAKIEAHGEMDWNQHDQWACAFGQLSDRFDASQKKIEELEQKVKELGG